MKRLVLLSTVGILFFACSQKPAETVEEAVVVDVEAPIAKIELANFDAEAGNYVATEVEVSGIVDHVCKHGGKKLLLVADDASVHINAESRFDDELVGTVVNVKGIVVETRIDEGTCLKMEEDNIAEHKEGEKNEEDFAHRQNQIKTYRDSMAVAGIDHLSYYSLDFVSFIE